MRTLSDSGGGLVIQAPLWIGLLLIALGVLLTIAVFVRRVPRRAARMSGLLAAVLFLVAGWHLSASRAVFESRGFYTESIYGEEQRVGWLQVSGVAPGATNPLVLHLRSGGELGVDLSGLSHEEQGRVATYVRARLKR